MLWMTKIHHFNRHIKPEMLSSLKCWEVPWKDLLGAQWDWNMWQWGMFWCSGTSLRLKEWMRAGGSRSWRKSTLSCWRNSRTLTLTSSSPLVSSSSHLRGLWQMQRSVFILLHCSVVSISSSLPRPWVWDRRGLYLCWHGDWGRWCFRAGGYNSCPREGHRGERKGNCYIHFIGHWKAVR